jgi:2,3-bisphosphoglycerate-independent phosphoglycerate mutase
VPLILVGAEARELKSGTLADIAPTILGIFGIEPPDVWTGRDLVVN